MVQGMSCGKAPPPPPKKDKKKPQNGNYCYNMVFDQI